MRRWLESFDGGHFAASVPHDKVYKALDGRALSDSPMVLIREADKDPTIVARYQYAVNIWDWNASTLCCAVLGCAVLCCASPLRGQVRQGRGSSACLSTWTCL